MIIMQRLEMYCACALTSRAGVVMMIRPLKTVAPASCRLYRKRLAFGAVRESLPSAESKGRPPNGRRDGGATLSDETPTQAARTCCDCNYRM